MTELQKKMLERLLEQLDETCVRIRRDETFASAPPGVAAKVESFVEGMASLKKAAEGTKSEFHWLGIQQQAQVLLLRGQWLSAWWVEQNNGR